MTHEATVSLTLADGTTTGPVPLSAMKAAVERVKRKGGAPKMRPDPDFDQAADKAYGIAAAELLQFVERIERLEVEKAEIAALVKEVFAEAKGRGYDTKAMRWIVALRKQDPDARAEFEAVVEMYRAALGM